ncbi:MAG: hypothetical protein PHE83_19090 [Opitutaceae bacterium]|nr:hypothetical protein [Opitutaceae bacterium]
MTDKPDTTDAEALYHVHAYATVRVKVCGIKARSHKEAMEKADAILADELDVACQRMFHSPDVHDKLRGEIAEVAYADEIAGYLVDEAGDEGYKNSRSYGSGHEPEDDAFSGKPKGCQDANKTDAVLLETLKRLTEMATPYFTGPNGRCPGDTPEQRAILAARDAIAIFDKASDVSMPDDFGANRFETDIQQDLSDAPSM